MQNGTKMKPQKQQTEVTMPKRKSICKQRSHTTQREMTICDQLDNARNKDY